MGLESGSLRAGRASFLTGGRASHTSGCSARRLRGREEPGGGRGARVSPGYCICPDAQTDAPQVRSLARPVRGGLNHVRLHLPGTPARGCCWIARGTALRRGDWRGQDRPRKDPGRVGRTEGGRRREGAWETLRSFRVLQEPRRNSARSCGGGGLQAPWLQVWKPTGRGMAGRQSVSSG